jgi:tRNA-uridine 2-sulfurtransferase
VIKLDAANKRVIVGPREALKQNEIAISDVNWLGVVPLGQEPQAIYARIRSTRAPVLASIRVAGDQAIVAIEGGEYGVSPGQACVFYEGLGAGMRVLGGGFISVQGPRVAFTRSATVALSA